jgi:hypothetical protein
LLFVEFVEQPAWRLRLVRNGPAPAANRLQIGGLGVCHIDFKNVEEKIIRVISI